MKNKTNCTIRRHRGFFLAESIAALVILGLLLSAIAVVQYSLHKTAAYSADHRDATFQAERYLTSLQAGAAAPALPDGVTLTVRELNHTPAGRWMEVQADVDSTRITLVGLVPAAPKTAIPATTPKEGAQ